MSVTLDMVVSELRRLADDAERRAERHEQRATDMLAGQARIEATQAAQAREIAMVQAAQTEVGRAVVDLRVGQSEMRAQLTEVAAAAKRHGFLEGLTGPDGYLRTPGGIAAVAGVLGLLTLVGVGLGLWSREDAAAVTRPAILAPAPQPAAAPQP